MAEKVTEERTFVKDNPDLFKFVSEQRGRVLKILEKHPSDKNAQKSLPGVVRRYDQLISYIDDLLSEATVRKSPVPFNGASSKIDLSPSDLEDLPEELLKNLSLTESDFFDFQIINAVESGGGTMSLDHILITLYKKSGEIHERLKISQRIYRIIVKKKLFPVEGKKAVYTTIPPANGSDEKETEGASAE